MFEIGEKVRFLNEQGEGTIKGFKGKNLVLVEVEDGFEIPVLATELVKISQKKESDQIENSSVPVIDIKRENVTIIGNPGLFLAFIPVTGVFSNEFRVHLINNSEVGVLFSLSSFQKNYHQGISHGSLVPATSQLIGDYDLKDILNWESLYVQVIFFKQGIFKPLLPVDKRIEIKASRFKQINLLKPAPLINDNAYLFDIATIQEAQPVTLEMLDQTFSANSLREKLRQDVHAPSTRRENLSSIRTNPKTGHVEVDLHIEEIMDKWEGLSNAEIVTFQLGHCRKAIEKAISSKARKITIIHGVGNGRLKTEVRNLLRSYDFQFYDAPPEKFGYGATEVLLK